MTLSVGRLDYPALLLMPSRQAFLAALTQTYVLDFDKYLTNQGLQLLAPTAPLSADPSLTQAVVTDPRQLISDAPIEYTRMDLNAYIGGCSRYFPESVGLDAVSMAAWLLNEHHLYFDPAELTIVSAPSQSEDVTQLGEVHVTVDPANYLWYGTLVLWLVPVAHLGLKAYRGVATGIRPADVGITNP